MYTKTSAFQHAEYFDTVSDGAREAAFRQLKPIKINRSHSDTFLKFKDTATVTADSGIALIILASNPKDPSTFQEYVLQGSIAIHPNICFNVLSITESCSIYLNPAHDYKPEMVQTHYRLTVRELSESIMIPKVYGFFYQIKTPPYSYTGDQHDYFEMTIVDQGELIHIVDGQEIVTRKHDCLIYFPNQVHSQSIKKDGITTYLSIMFKASGIDTSLKNKVVHLNNHYTYLLEKMVELSNRPTGQYYADEIINLFKTVIIQMLKNQDVTIEEPNTSMRENYENELFQSIIEYVHQHVEDENQVNDIVTRFSLSRSTLQLLFKKYTGMSPKNYINRVRLNRSKLLIRESKLSLSEIAASLGYGSLQYFSRAFSKEFGLSPSNYAKAILK